MSTSSRTREDTRTHFVICPSETKGFPSEKACSDMKEMLVNVNERNLEILTGGRVKGKARRKYFMKFSPKQKPLYKAIETFMKAIIPTILSEHHPHFRHQEYCTKFGAIKNLAGAESQYKGHDNKLHSDYPDQMLEKPIYEQPMSIIFALDQFNFMHLLLKLPL